MKAKFLHFKNYIIFQIKMPHDRRYLAHVIEKSEMSFKFFLKAVLQYYLFGTIKPSEQKMKKDDIV